MIQLFVIEHGKNYKKDQLFGHVLTFSQQDDNSVGPPIFAETGCFKRHPEGFFYLEGNGFSFGINSLEKGSFKNGGLHGMGTI